MKSALCGLCLALLLSFTAQAAQLTACTAGTTNCSNDTLNDAGLAAAITDATASGVQNRVYTLCNQQCLNVYSEVATTTGHINRVRMCQAIATGLVAKDTLVSLVLTTSPNVQAEILAGQGPPPAFTPIGGNMVDADVNTAIGAFLTVTATTASTTATGSSGAANITVASATNIVPGQTVFATGVPAGTTVAFVSGTTVYLSAALTAALSSTPIAFTLYTGLPTKF